MTTSRRSLTQGEPPLGSWGVGEHAVGALDSPRGLDQTARARHQLLQTGLTPGTATFATLPFFTSAFGAWAFSMVVINA